MRHVMIDSLVTKKEEPVVRRPAYFWWFLANMLALSFAVSSWLACLHVFGNPEIPRNYRLLKRLGRLPEIQRHTVLDVPNGSLLDPKSLYSRYISKTETELAAINRQLMRNYLTNFDHALGLTYIEGEYRVEAVRELNDGDFIRHGLVVRARGMVAPDGDREALPYPVLIEYIFPTMEEVGSGAFRVGDLLDVKKSPNCAAILHVGHTERDGENLVCATVVPIAYGGYRIGGGRSMAIEPPKEVNLEAGFPAFR